MRTFTDWSDPPPDFVEVDFVAHSGTSAAGAFAQTLVLTDIATGWNECVPVVMRAGALVLEVLQAAQKLFPFPLRGEAQSAMTAVEVLARLKHDHPDRFTDDHQRTIQRMVKSGRALEAKEIIQSPTAALVLIPGDPRTQPMAGVANING